MPIDGTRPSEFTHDFERVSLIDSRQDGLAHASNSLHVKGGQL